MFVESTQCCFCGLDVQVCVFPMSNEQIQELVTCQDGVELSLMSVVNESLMKSVCQDSPHDRVVRSPPWCGLAYR